MNNISNIKDRITWHKACHVNDIPENGGACALIEGKQIAIFNFARRGEWYATDNLCPHRQQMAIARGMIGSQGDEPKVACPFHKKTFSLRTGECLSDDSCHISTFPIQIREESVFIGL